MIVPRRRTAAGFHLPRRDATDFWRSFTSREGCAIDALSIPEPSSASPPPREILSELKTFPIREETAQFADGGKARWKIGEVRLEVGWPFGNHSGAFWQEGDATAAWGVQPRGPWAFRGFSPPPPRAHPIVVVAVSRGSSCRSERPGSRVRDGAALDSPGRGMRGALDYRIRMLPLRSVPPSVGAGGG